MESQSLTIDLKDGERIDDLQRSGLRIIQDPKRFCFGIDAVLLSGFVKSTESGNILDLCTGTGIIPLLLSAKTNADKLFGIEIQKDSAEMADRSVRMNHLSEKVEIVCGDIKDIRQLYAAGSMDAVTCNPPYMLASHGLTNPDSTKAIARHEILCDFTDVAAAAKWVLKPGGSLYLVHRPFRLVELFRILTEHKLEPKRMKMIHPFIDEEPNMVLIEAVYGGKSRLTVEKPLVVYKEKGKYTDEIYDIYGY